MFHRIFYLINNPLKIRFRFLIYIKNKVLKIVLLIKFEEFKEINEKKEDDGIHIPKARLNFLKKRKSFFNKWVCLIATDSTILNFQMKYPGKPFDIKFGSHRILLNTESQFKKAKNKYKEGNIYKKEIIRKVNFHHYNPLIDSMFFGDGKK